MSRERIKALKKIMHTGGFTEASELQKIQARAAALELLQRSVVLKHDQLALIRLADAVKLGASVDSASWNYCGSLANAWMNRAGFAVRLAQ